MNVYILDADANRYQNLVLVDDDEWDELGEWFDGSPIGSAWRPVQVEVLREHKKRPPSDFPSLSPIIPVFSERAVESIGPLLKPHGEILPLDCREGVYYAFNTTCVIDALDQEQSQFERFRDGRVMDIKRHVFDADKIGISAIFLLPYLRRSRVYVTDLFVERVQEARLTGFDFRLVWPDSSS